MKPRTTFRESQSGAFLLEALIGILIFSLGVLGIVGLQARAIRYTSDAEYRAEAMYLANSLISQMWTDDPSNLKNKYDSSVGNAGYTDFVTRVNAGLSGAIVPLPVVTVDGPAPLPQKSSATSSVVQVQIQWRLPGDLGNTGYHNYTTTGIIGRN